MLSSCRAQHVQHVSVTKHSKSNTELGFCSRCCCWGRHRIKWYNTDIWMWLCCSVWTTWTILTDTYWTFKNRVKVDCCGLTSSLWAPSHPELLVGPSYCPEPKPEDKDRTELSHIDKYNISGFRSFDRCLVGFVWIQLGLIFLILLWTDFVMFVSVSGLTGIPCSCGLSSRLWSSFLDASIFSGSAASTM